MQSTLSKQATKTKGYTLFIIGMIAEMAIILMTLAADKITSSAWLVVIIQIIPLIFIEGGLYFIFASSRMKVTDVSSKEYLDEYLLSFGRVYDIFRDFVVSGIMILLGILFFSVLVYSIYTKGLVLNQYIIWIFFTILFYLVFLRRFLIYFIQKKKEKGIISPFFNMWFWLSVLFVILGLFLIYAGITGFELPGGEIKSPWLITLIGIGVLLLSAFFLHQIATNKTIKYEFRGAKLALIVPHMGKGKEIILNISGIKKVKKLNIAEYLSLLESYNKQLNFHLRSVKDLMDFGRGKIKRPRYYIFTTGASSVVLLQGADFIYLICVEDTDKFISKIKRLKRT